MTDIPHSTYTRIHYTGNIMRKQLIWLGMGVGSFVGGYIPSLWGADYFSLWGVVFTAIGGFVGIWLGFKLGS